MRLLLDEIVGIRIPSQVHPMMDGDLEQTIEQLESAVRAAMNPETSHEIRMRAYQVLPLDYRSTPGSVP